MSRGAENVTSSFSPCTSKSMICFFTPYISETMNCDSLIDCRVKNLCWYFLAIVEAMESLKKIPNTLR